MKDAFTLVEVLVVTLLLSVIMAALYSVLVVGERGFRQDGYLLDLQQQARQCMEGMLREIRQARVSNITSLEPEEIEFRILNIDDQNKTAYIRYYKEADQIFREHPAGSTKLIGYNISYLNFTCVDETGNCTSCLSSPIFQIQLRASKSVGGQTYHFPTDTTLKGIVRLRN